MGAAPVGACGLETSYEDEALNMCKKMHWIYKMITGLSFTLSFSIDLLNIV